MNHASTLRAVTRIDGRCDALEARLAVLERTAIDRAPSGDRDMHIIVLAVADTIGISPASIMSKGRTQRVAWARQVSLWLCRTLLRRSSEDVARHFGCDSSNVRHACAKLFSMPPGRDMDEADRCKEAAKQKLATRETP